MLAQGFKNFSDIPLAVTGLLLFVGVYVAVLAWLALRGHHATGFIQSAQLPLNDDGGSHE